MANSNIKFEDIQRVNQSIKTTNIKGKEYAEVNQRIKAFRQLYPQGTISTEIISLEDNMCVMKATVMNEDGAVLGSGHAFEIKQGMINSTSYIENCETSAVGRALGMCGFGIDTSVASYEEVNNAIAQQEQAKSSPAKKKIQEEESKKEVTPRENDYSYPDIQEAHDLLSYCVAEHISWHKVWDSYKLNKDTDAETFKKVLTAAKNSVEKKKQGGNK